MHLPIKRTVYAAFSNILKLLLLALRMKKPDLWRGAQRAWRSTPVTLTIFFWVRLVNIRCKALWDCRGAIDLRNDITRRLSACT